MSKQLMIEWMSAGQVSVPKLLLKHYTEIGLNEEELVLLIHVYTCLEEGYGFPTPEDLSQRMTHSSLDCSKMLRQLVKRGYLRLEELNDSDGVFSECYSLEPLWEQLVYLFSKREEKAEENRKQDEEINIYMIYEQEFSRPLSPMEGETLSMWLDQDNHSPQLIVAALREAVVSGKLNFRYIDRILFEWQKNNIKTVQEAKAYGEKFRKTQAKPRGNTNQAEAFPTYNWLEK
ncbi:DnaD domain-containing protein [Bacillus alkalicellulosilyticus]|uniref:DnaD domain-containing protein n=1 Tax=Alkalihalobacterium alkalicellulosilyticum TaxID=1912214 RepID=UPI000998A5BA|nr:DnaD domain-containing protein [Bacillus alkalicellulosilyticus]